MSQQEIMQWTNGHGPIDFGVQNLTTGPQGLGYMTNFKQVTCATSVFTLTPKITLGQIEEACTSQRGVAFSYIESQKYTASLKMFGFDRDTLALALNASTSLAALGTVTGENKGTVAAGDIIHLNKPGATSVVLTDSTGTPVTLVEGTHYEYPSVENKSRIKIKDVTTLVMPVLAAYSYGANGIITPIAQIVTRGLIFSGASTKPSSTDKSRARVIVPRVSWAMNGGFDWFSKKPAELELTGDVEMTPELIDTDFGGFWRVDGLPD